MGAGADAGARVDESVRGRLCIYGDAWRWWRDSPLFGTGLGSFETIYPSYQDFELRAVVAHAHSDWLELALETGLLGLLAALAAAALAALRAPCGLWRAARSREMRALIGGALAAAAAFSAHSLFEFSFQIPGNAVVFMALVGFLLSAPSWADKAADRARPNRLPRGRRSLPRRASCFWRRPPFVRRPRLGWRTPPGIPASGPAASRGPTPSTPIRRSWKKLASIDYEAGRQSDWGQSQRPARRPRLLHGGGRPAPFDFESLSFAGASLWRLGRAADARALFEKARVDPISLANFR